MKKFPFSTLAGLFLIILFSLSKPGKGVSPTSTIASQSVLPKDLLSAILQRITWSGRVQCTLVSKELRGAIIGKMLPRVPSYQDIARIETERKQLIKPIKYLEAIISLEFERIFASLKEKYSKTPLYSPDRFHALLFISYTIYIEIALAQIGELALQLQSEIINTRIPLPEGSHGEPGQSETLMIRCQRCRGEAKSKYQNDVIDQSGWVEALSFLKKSLRDQRLLGQSKCNDFFPIEAKITPLIGIFSSMYIGIVSPLKEAEKTEFLKIKDPIKGFTYLEYICLNVIRCDLKLKPSFEGIFDLVQNNPDFETIDHSRFHNLSFLQKEYLDLLRDQPMAAALCRPLYEELIKESLDNNNDETILNSSTTLNDKATDINSTFPDCDLLQPDGST